MRRQFLDGVVRMSIGMGVGGGAGALYAGLISALRLGMSARWDRISAFALGCVLAGALLGLLGAIVSALVGKAALRSSPPADPSHVPEGQQGSNRPSPSPLGAPAERADGPRSAAQEVRILVEATLRGKTDQVQEPQFRAGAGRYINLAQKDAAAPDEGVTRPLPW